MTNQLPTTAEEIIDKLLRGELDEDIADLVDAIRTRQKTLQQKKARSVLKSIEPGDRVVVSGRIKPLYMQGSEGTVKSKQGSKVLVDFGQRQGRFGSQVWVPAGVLSKIEGE